MIKLNRTWWMVSAAVALMLTVVGCGREQQTTQEQTAYFWRLVESANNYPDDTTLNAIDSLSTVGKISLPVADYLRGIVYDRQSHIQTAKRYYTKSYEALDPDRDGWAIYLEVVGQLSQICMTTGDLKGSLEVATEALDRASKAGQLTDEGKIPLLWSISSCQYALNLSESEETAKQVYTLLEKEAREHGLDVSPNELVFSSLLIGHQLTAQNYAKADSLLRQAETMLEKLDQPGYKNMRDEYTWKLAMMKVRLLDGQGATEEAYALFEKTLPTMKETPDGLIMAAYYLMDKGLYAEAAEMYDLVDAMLPADNRNAEPNLDNIGISLIPRLQANLGANRKDSVVAIAARIADSFDQALDNDRENNAAELATLYDTQGKEMQIAQQQARLSRQRLVGTGIALVLLTAFFLIYTWYRRRAQRRLATAHERLQTAYDQLEETTAAKERIESELRIARDIQMSMVPGVFPEYKGLDMYALMAPAKEVGGDLYGYVYLPAPDGTEPEGDGGRLYFCVGDVSGKGVPASLFMAQSVRLFRTLATEGLMPADIATRMNLALVENNDRGMFVTMFIGLLHLSTGRLDFCNCGHNAPVIDGQFLPMQYDNQPLGLWEDDPFEGETIDDIRGRQLLIYTDGLNEAENRRQERLGNDRLLELMADTQSLTSREVIDRLREAVARHRDGAEPNDDLTLMCVRMKN